MLGSKIQLCMLSYGTRSKTCGEEESSLWQRHPSIHHPGAGNNKKWERGRVKSLVSGLSMTGSPNRAEKADGQFFLWMAQEVGREEEEVSFPFLVNDVCSNIIDKFTIS